MASRGVIAQRLTLMAGLDVRACTPRSLRIGPLKILLDDTALPSPEALRTRVADAHAAGCTVAIHCVTAEQLILAAAALEAAGAAHGDRIEHAAVVPPGYAELLAALGVTVVTQPGFLGARGDDYLRDVRSPERSWLYPCASLLRAGVAVAGSSDMPFGPLDPWQAIVTAVGRRSPSGAAIGLHEAVDAATALRLYLGRADDPGTPRRVTAGEPADLCVLRNGLAQVLADPGAH
jgi:predicted amidohydrolase YtcJ